MMQHLVATGTGKAGMRMQSRKQDTDWKISQPTYMSVQEKECMISMLKEKVDQLAARLNRREQEEDQRENNY
jgi:protein-tyrosine-phosphatase